MAGALVLALPLALFPFPFEHECWCLNMSAFTCIARKTCAWYVTTHVWWLGWSSPVFWYDEACSLIYHVVVVVVVTFVDQDRPDPSLFFSLQNYNVGRLGNPHWFSMAVPQPDKSSSRSQYIVSLGPFRSGRRRWCTLCRRATWRVSTRLRWPCQYSA